MVDYAGVDVGKMLMRAEWADVRKDSLVSALESSRCHIRSRPLLLAVDLLTVYPHVLF